MDDLSGFNDDSFLDDEEDEVLSAAHLRRSESSLTLPSFNLDDLRAEAFDDEVLDKVVLFESYDDGSELSDQLTVEHRKEAEKVSETYENDFGAEFGDYPEVDVSGVVPAVEPSVDDSFVGEAPAVGGDVIDSGLAGYLSALAGGVDEDEEDEDDDSSVSGVRPTFVKSNSAFYDDDDEDESDESARLFGFDLDGVLADGIDAKASDVDLNADDVVSFKINGEVFRQYEKYPELNKVITQRVQQNILSHVLQEAFIEELEMGTSYVLKTGRHKGRRARLQIGKSFGNIFMVFRLIADRIPTFTDLDISDILLDWTKLPKGLVMVNGATNTGKSTTMASMIQEIQLTTRKKIITLEKPVEYIYGNRGESLVTQIEIGRDARSFAKALKGAMRSSPDVILVGEVRDREEVDALLQSAESGHLTLSTMHTDSAPATINRIKSLFNGDEQERVLSTLGDVTRGFANQVLVKGVDGGRFAVREILDVDDEVQSLILNGDSRGIKKFQTDHAITMEHELVRAVRAGRCTAEEAITHTVHPRFFTKLLSEKF